MKMASTAKRRSKGSKASDGKRKRKYSGSDEDGPAFLSSKYAEPPTSKIYNNRFKHNTPDQLFRADLISAMKMPDSEPLSPDEYVIIDDSWRTEWERGVQVPVDPESLPEPTFRILRKRNKDAHYKLPKKLIRLTRDSLFDPEIHSMSYANTLAERTCRYDMDDLDYHWLTMVNNDREDFGLLPMKELFMEKVIEEFEVQTHNKKTEAIDLIKKTAYVNFQEAIKSEEGLGVEYDEDAICDVCRSPDSHESNEMVFCDSCNICVHQICYGITKIPEGSWICRTCALGIRPPCVLCPNRGGAMKTIRCGQKWAHVGCAVWIPEVSFFNFVKMEPIIKISLIPPSRWALVCSLCNNKTGACIQCSEKNCKVAFHVTCAFNEGLQMRASVKHADTDDDALKAFCKKHSNKRSIIFSDSEEDEQNGTKRDSLSSEERANIRQQKILEKEAEFYKYVNTEDIAEQFEVDVTDIITIYNYWKLKRKGNSNRPFLTPKVDKSEDPVEEENSPFHFLKKLVLHRRDLERARNLCYMVKNREKITKNWIQSKEAIFNKQLEILNKEGKKLSESELAAVLNANFGDLAYDKKYSGENGPSPNMVSVLTNLVGEDPMRTKLNGIVKSSKKNDTRNSGKTPNPYAKHYLNGLIMRTQRFISTAAHKQKKVQFPSDTLQQEETENLTCSFQGDVSNLSNSNGEDVLKVCSDLEDNSSTFIQDVSVSNNVSIPSSFKCKSEFPVDVDTEEKVNLNLLNPIQKENGSCISSPLSLKIECQVESNEEGKTEFSLVDCSNELQSHSMIDSDDKVEPTDADNLPYVFDTQTSIKVENGGCVYFTNAAADGKVNVKIEDAELIYIPDLDVGANVKMEQTDCLLDLKEIYNSESVEVESYVYNCEIDTDNVYMEEFVYNSNEVCDTQVDIETDIVNVSDEINCDKDDERKVIDIKTNLSNTKLVENDTNHSKDACNKIELSLESANPMKDTDQLCDSPMNVIPSFPMTDSDNSIQCNVLSSEESKLNQPTKTVSAENYSEPVKIILKENHKFTKRKKDKSLSIKSSSITISHKKGIYDKNNLIKPNIKSAVVDPKQAQSQKSKIGDFEANGVENTQSDISVHVNNTVEKPNFDTMEKNLKLEVKKNNSRTLPLPYVVLKSEDVVKCVKVGDTIKYVKSENTVPQNKASEIRQLSEKEQLNKKFAKVNGLTRKPIPSESSLNKKSKSNEKIKSSDKLKSNGSNKSSPLRTNSPTQMKVTENGVFKSNKSGKRKFNPEVSPVFSKQPIVKLKHLNNLSPTSSVSKQPSSSTTKCQEKTKSSEKPENNSTDSKDSSTIPDKTLPSVPRKDAFRGYKIPKKPQSNKPEENSLDLRRGNTPLSPLPDITSSSLSGYHSKTTWRNLEPRSENPAFCKTQARNSDMYSQENPSERLVLTLRKDTTDPESQRWKADPNAFNRSNCRRNWNAGQTPPLPPPPPFPHLLQPGPWSLMNNQVNFRPIHSNYSHGPFT